MNWKRYAKAGVAALVPILILANTLLNGQNADAKQIEDLVVGVAGVIAVFQVPNAPAPVVAAPGPVVR